MGGAAASAAPGASGGLLGPLCASPGCGEGISVSHLRRPGFYDRRGRRDVALSVVNAVVVRVLRAVARSRGLLGDSVRLVREERGRWFILRVFHPEGASFFAVYVSTQEKLRPRDVERILRMYVEERRRTCCVTEELAVIVYRGATSTAEDMLRGWVREAPKIRHVVKADVMSEGGVKAAVARLVERFTRLVKARLIGVARALRNALERGVRSVDTRFTALAVLVAKLAEQFGLIEHPEEATLLLHEAVSRMGVDTGPPPSRLLEALRRGAPWIGY